MIQNISRSNSCNVCFDKSVYYCSECGHYYCKYCNEKVHQHPERVDHNPKFVNNRGDLSLDSTQEELSISQDESITENSLSVEQSFLQAEIIATFAERFHITAIKNFQKEIIQATLDGRDTLVLYPTGSGKSICFQFPPVFLKKKAIIITPTISLMQEQVNKLNGLGIQSVFLGSAQSDKQAEILGLNHDSEISLTFVTPEWITKP